MTEVSNKIFLFIGEEIKNGQLNVAKFDLHLKLSYFASII